MRSITVQIEDGAQLVDVSIVDGQGGVVWVAQGGYRGQLDLHGQMNTISW